MRLLLLQLIANHRALRAFMVAKWEQFIGARAEKKGKTGKEGGK